jgi:hypothetical protein
LADESACRASYKTEGHSLLKTLCISCHTAHWISCYSESYSLKESDTAVSFNIEPCGVRVKNTRERKRSWPVLFEAASELLNASHEISAACKLWAVVRPMKIKG